MNEKIEWEDSDTRVYRCWLRVVRIWEAPSGRIGGQTEGSATVEDLRRACAAAGLTLATAQHEEDLAKLGKEMNEIATQRDAARDIVASTRELVGAQEDESLGHAITRVLGREDHERGAHLRLLDEVIAFGEVIGTKPDESIANAARRVVAERNAAIARAEIAEARLGTSGVLAARAERDALAAELAAIRAATGEEPTDAGLLTAYQDTWSRTAGDVEGRTAARRALYNLGRTAALGEVARTREEVATLRARVAELEAAPVVMGIDHAAGPDRSVETTLAPDGTVLSTRDIPAPQGQPVATDEELRRVFADAEAPVRHSGAGFSAAERAGVAAVARHVRAERPACLVARAVALGCDVRLLRNTIDTSLWSLTVGGEAGTRHNIAASEVPGAMGLALDYAARVAAGRKGGAK